jgi:pimeloyl-ACP methyl ester carboxylesterase
MQRSSLIASLLILVLAATPTNTPAQDIPMSEDHVADIDGLRLYYRTVGAGPSLLLLHGFSGSGAWWDSMIPELATTYRLIIPDLPGHGASTGPGDPYVYREVAAQLFKLLDHAGIEETLAVGYSTGGELLLHMAHQQGHRIPGMAVVSAIHRTTDSIRAALRSWPDYDATPPMVKEYWRQNHRGGERQIRSLINGLRSLADVPDNFSFRAADLATFRTPVLIVAGDRDDMVPIAIAEEMHAGIPQSALWIVPMHGHPVLWPDWGGSEHARHLFPSVLTAFFESLGKDNS